MQPWGLGLAWPRAEATQGAWASPAGAPLSSCLTVQTSVRTALTSRGHCPRGKGGRARGSNSHKALWSGAPTQKQAGLLWSLKAVSPWPLPVSQPLPHSRRSLPAAPCLTCSAVVLGGREGGELLIMAQSWEPRAMFLGRALPQVLSP